MKAKQTLSNSTRAEHFDVVVIGAGQAGLSVGHELQRLGARFVILEARARIGDQWRARWDSLRLFTPAGLDGLNGMAFPGDPHAFPSKDAFADYLEAYAERFGFAVRCGVGVERLSARAGRYVIATHAGEFETDNVVVALGNFQGPRRPAFARELDPAIVQLHASEYRNPKQLRAGGVLLVGAGNSGAEIALEVARSHDTWLAGRDTGHLPFRPDGWAARWFFTWLVLRLVFHRLLTVRTPFGRKVRPKVLHRGGPLIRVQPEDLRAAGVQRVARMIGVERGRPVLEDGRGLDVANVIWCNGFEPGFSFIDLPIFDTHGLPQHQSGVVPRAPGLYFVGMHFQHAMSSGMIHGVGRDAARIARLVARRVSDAARGRREARDLRSDGLEPQPGATS